MKTLERCPVCHYEEHYCICEVEQAEKIGMSKRERQFMEFGGLVCEHIDKYTIAQYGDIGADPCTDYTKADFDTIINKYVTRQRNGGGARGLYEDMRDYIKIAHYAAMCYMMMRHELNIRNLMNEQLPKE
jgi:hypothetical protein